MLMMGYAFDHPSGTYEMFNPATDTIIISNSVQWSSFSRWDVQASDPAVGKVLQSLSIRPSVIVDDPIRSTPHVNFANNPPQVIADDATAVSSAAKSLSLSILLTVPLLTTLVIRHVAPGVKVFYHHPWSLFPTQMFSVP